MVAKRCEQAKISRSERSRRRHVDDGSFARLTPVMLLSKEDEAKERKIELTKKIGRNSGFAVAAQHSECVRQW